MWFHIPLRRVTGGNGRLKSHRSQNKVLSSRVQGVGNTREWGDRMGVGGRRVSEGREAGAPKGWVTGEKKSVGGETTQKSVGAGRDKSRECRKTG